MWIYVPTIMYYYQLLLLLGNSLPLPLGTTAVNWTQAATERQRLEKIWNSIFVLQYLLR